MFGVAPVVADFGRRERDDLSGVEVAGDFSGSSVMPVLKTASPPRSTGVARPAPEHGAVGEKVGGGGMVFEI